MLKIKILGSIVGALLLAFFATQIGNVSAQTKKAKNNIALKKPLTRPLTRPLCKPGWGYGDKNHCHYGPPGKVGR